MWVDSGIRCGLTLMGEDVFDRSERDHDESKCGVGEVETGGRLMMRWTRRFSPSCLALFTPSLTAARMPSRRLRMVLARLTKGFIPLRCALEQNRSTNMASSSSQKSPAKMARSASFRA
jgi:hypothetical protein